MNSPSITSVLYAARALKKAQTPLRFMSAVSWDDAMREPFIKHGTLPAPKYPPVDTSEAREHIARARRHISECIGNEEVFVCEWLGRLADTLTHTANLIDARGTPEFFAHSTELFGRPERLMLDRKTRVIDMAHHLDDTLSTLDFDHLVMDGVERFLSDREFAEDLEGRLHKHFGDDAPAVEISQTLSAKAAASSSRIRVRAGAQFTERDVYQLLQHEALIHTATALNGRAQRHFKILGRAHAGTTMIQEGLAVFAEIISAAMDPRRFQRLAARVIAIQMCVDGADFKQVFDFFLERTDDPDGSYHSTRRIFRGGPISGGAPFTKDMVYLNGLLRVHNFMRTVVSLNRADLIRLLFVGKMDIEDVPAIAKLYSQGHIRAAKFLPPWVEDMRFLVSYLSYSSFLNQVKMPGFQKYYEDRLEGVPVVWDQDEAKLERSARLLAE